VSDSTSSRFSITLRGEVVATSDDPFIAAAAYRAALMRGDLRAEWPEVALMRDGVVWRSAQAGRVKFDLLDLPEPSINDVFKQLMAGSMTERELVAALHAVGFPVSNSQVQGWFASESNRRHRQMTVAELYAVAKALLWHDNQQSELDAG
jgi:hypothetical protein